MKIAAAQMELVPDIETNTRRIKEFIEQAAVFGVDIMAFPETALTGYYPELFRSNNEEKIDEKVAELHQFVQEKGVSAIVGTPYFEEGKLYNSIVVLLTDGRKLLYHKQNLVDYEEVYFEPGRKQLVFEYKGFTIGAIVCRDQNFPLLAREIKEQGAEILFISCAHYYNPMEARWKLDKNRALPIARATENKMYVCKANAVGSMNGLINLGNSLIVGPNGVVISLAGEGKEQLLTFAIDPHNKDWKW
ncbi:MAG: carbon-nitrogen hydrolase family protein [bacterium]